MILDGIIQLQSHFERQCIIRCRQMAKESKGLEAFETSEASSYLHLRKLQYKKDVECCGKMSATLRFMIPEFNPEEVFSVKSLPRFCKT